MSAGTDLRDQPGFDDRATGCTAQLAALCVVVALLLGWAGETLIDRACITPATTQEAHRG